jgi:hypothetical protein
MRGEEDMMEPSVVDPFVGSWTYRSFQNLPDPDLTFNDLFFGQGTLIIAGFDPGSFSGRLVFRSGAEMRLTGASSFGNPFSVRFQGRGVSEGIEDFVYDYVGYLVPAWPNGVNQVPALVGSIVRTEPHGGGAEPGEVASWVAVKRD